jgi:hypothetical protein
MGEDNAVGSSACAEDMPFAEDGKGIVAAIGFLEGFAEILDGFGDFGRAERITQTLAIIQQRERGGGNELRQGLVFVGDGLLCHWVLLADLDGKQGCGEFGLAGMRLAILQDGVGMICEQDNRAVDEGENGFV